MCTHIQKQKTNISDRYAKHAYEYITDTDTEKRVPARPGQMTTPEAGPEASARSLLRKNTPAVVVVIVPAPFGR